MMSAAKVALVTGSSRGIGRAIAIELARTGWNVAINYHSNHAAAMETVQAAKDHNGQVEMIQADIASEQDRNLIMKFLREKFGRIDLLVNNAGIAPRQRVDLLQVTPQSFEEVMAANLKGPFFLTQAIARWMSELIASNEISSGRIINIGSISAYTASPERAEYCLSKAALGMMTALFATRLADQGILVYEIRPGIIETDMTSVVKPKYDRLISEGLTPIKRWGLPEDVARAVSTIASGALAFSTGEVINVDGGFHLRRL